ncbi:MAG: alpha-amylase [Candidatus Cloacimonetes bacterium]|nr:alpha-amylase [Candidatus Cloacimonadota bacterium]
MARIIFIISVLFLFAGCNATNSSGQMLNDPPQSPGITYWWNDTVFYEIFVRSFYDSDGDGIGDLPGIIEKLDYLNDGNPDTNDDLGITGIWLMPVTQSPSYHGYDTTDYYTIEEDYGTNEDFQNLIAACHARGIKVVVDFVMNHCSSQHPWFLASQQNDPEYRNWFRWESSDPGYLGPWGQPVWHLGENGEYYYGLFWSGMPDLNFAYQPVIDEILSITDFWLQDMQVDGFRCDAVKYIFEDGQQLENVPQTFTWWEDFHSHYTQINPDAMAVGEAWDDTDIVAQYADNRFDFCFEFDFAEAMIEAVNAASSLPVIHKIQEMKILYPYHQYGTFLTNHDQNRVFNALGESTQKAKFAASLYLTMSGIPFIYYGEEIGMKGTKPDPDIRRPMQWNATENGGFSSATPWHNLNSNYTSINVENQQADSTSLWRHYNQLITWRTAHPALSRGTLQLLNSSNINQLLMLRQYNDDILLVSLNFSSNGTRVQTGPTDLTPGSYRLNDLASGTEVAALTILANGDIAEECLLPPQEKYSLRLYQLEKIPREE